MQERRLKYQLDDKVPAGENMMYAFQQTVLFVASAVVMPVVVGYALGLSQSEVAATLQRTFVLCGVMTFLQVRFGHRFPIQERSFQINFILQARGLHINQQCNSPAIHAHILTR